MILFKIILLLMSIVLITSKLESIAKNKYGYLVMFSNFMYEFVEKKLSIKRTFIDTAGLFIIAIGWWYSTGSEIALVATSAFAISWFYAEKKNNFYINNNQSKQEIRYKKSIPLPNPKIILHINGPLLLRGKTYILGDLPMGHKSKFDLIIMNPTIVRPQFPLLVSIILSNKSIELTSPFKKTLQTPKPGECLKKTIQLKAVQLSETPVNIKIKLSTGSYTIEEDIRISSVFDPNKTPISNVVINRWKGGASAGFAWRGDMDLYDPGTFQSVEGLLPVLDLSRRYRIPSSMYLSGRLSLVKEEHYRFCEKLGVDRDTDGIEGFIEFMRREVSLKATIDFPFDEPKRFAMELGNHMYLHYGTHTAMDEGNHWKMGASIGEGNYFWKSSEADSLSEQRDNAIYNAKLIKEKLDYDVKSWAAPGRSNDKYTSAAIEAAGMVVGSNTNATTFDDVLKLRPPHHPNGCKKLVEINKKYPGDPDNIYKMAMLKYWMGYAVRKRRAFVLMVHHHALQYKGHACLAMTEEILRHALKDYRGNFFISTVHGLGEYWERVLCPQHRWVKAKAVAGNIVEIRNTGDETLQDIPVEITFNGDKKLLLLVKIPPETTTVINFTGDQCYQQPVKSFEPKN